VLRTRSRSNQRTRPPAHESPRALGVPSFCVEPGNRVGESPEFQEDQQANYRATDVEPTSCETRVRNLIHTAEHAQGVSGRSCVFAQRSRSRGGRCAPGPRSPRRRRAFGFGGDERRRKGGREGVQCRCGSGDGGPVTASLVGRERNRERAEGRRRLSRRAWTTHAVAQRSCGLSRPCTTGHGHARPVRDRESCGATLACPFRSLFCGGACGGWREIFLGRTTECEVLSCVWFSVD
jgi:hypothetical protein